MDAMERKQKFQQAKQAYETGNTKPTKAIGATPARKPILGLYAKIAKQNLSMGSNTLAMANANKQQR